MYKLQTIEGLNQEELVPSGQVAVLFILYPKGAFYVDAELVSLEEANLLVIPSGVKYSYQLRKTDFLSFNLTESDFKIQTLEVLSLDEFAVFCVQETLGKKASFEEVKALALFLLSRKPQQALEVKSTFEQMKAYIQQHLDEEITIKKLSEEFNVSTTTINQIFQKNIEQSPKAYLNEIRLNQVIDLLQNTQWNMKEIANSIGFQNLDSFSHFVKRQTGKSPSKIREEFGWLL
ncbi:MAG: AraC family transcriptional regulator [Lentisphaeria bacterium]|nr:AraC family transcriptional regulator [Lentisphaeria bacterium]